MTTIRVPDACSRGVCRARVGEGAEETRYSVDGLRLSACHHDVRAAAPIERLQSLSIAARALDAKEVK